MAHIALLHPQCARLGGAIKMVLLTAHALQKQWHKVEVYTFEHDHSCFPELQKNLSIIVIKNTAPGILQKPLQIGILAYKLRHVDMIIANNPPMQIVAALTKLFVPRIRTLWWHHHAPWYYGSLKPAILAKAIFEKFFILPFIDDMVATSYYVADIIRAYCGRASHVIHPVLDTIPDKITPIKPGQDKITLFTHGRLEEWKWLDMIVRIYEKIHNKNPNVHLIVSGMGKLETFLREKWITVIPFDSKHTFRDVMSGTYGHVLGIYCSSIDAFGMASLEAQIVGMSTLILDKGGAGETIVSEDDDSLVWHLVDSEDELCSRIQYYIDHKKFQKNMSIVNFSHHRDYFNPDRLSHDLLILMSKNKVQ